MKLNEKIKNAMASKSTLVRVLVLKLLVQFVPLTTTDLMLIISAGPGEERHLPAKL